MSHDIPSSALPRQGVEYLSRRKCQAPRPLGFFPGGEGAIDSVLRPSPLRGAVRCAAGVLRQRCASAHRTEGFSSGPHISRLGQTKQGARGPLFRLLAEREGFEPSVRC